MWGHSEEGAPVSMRPQSPQPQEHLEDKHLLLAMKRLKDLKDLFRQQTGCFHFLKAKINSITNLSVITTVCFAFFHYFSFGTVGTLVTTHSIFPLIHSTTGFFLNFFFFCILPWSQYITVSWDFLFVCVCMWFCFALFFSSLKDHTQKNLHKHSFCFPDSGSSWGHFWSNHIVLALTTFQRFITLGVWMFCLYVYHVCVWGLQMPEEVARAVGTAVMEGCELPRGAENQTQIPCKSNSALNCYTVSSAQILAFLILYNLCLLGYDSFKLSSLW